MAERNRLKTDREKHITDWLERNRLQSDREKDYRVTERNRLKTDREKQIQIGRENITDW